ncbi:MAG: HAD-IA family hydrolase [Candidatus Nanoarchaeia archaeon]|nr:HAD-IA family hydrolase [Candidatus Nanoarchaeia archaeon]
MKRAIIFDFDGVIVDSEKAKFETLKKLLKKEKVILNKICFRYMVGMKTKPFLKKYFKKELSNEQINNIYSERERYQLQNLKKYSKPIKGVKNFIGFLKNNHIKIGLATGSKKEVVNKILNEIGMKNKFDFKVTGEQFKTSKPNPEVYNKAIKKSKTSKKEIMAIEDSAAGIKSAKGAGLFCVGITTSQSKKELKRADLIVNSFNQIQKKLVKELNLNLY